MNIEITIQESDDTKGAPCAICGKPSTPHLIHGVGISSKSVCDDNQCVVTVTAQIRNQLMDALLNRNLLTKAQPNGFGPPVRAPGMAGCVFNEEFMFRRKDGKDGK